MVEAMSSPTIVLVSPTDSITLTGDRIEDQYIYDNDALTSWYALPEVEVDLDKRPNAHGVFDPGQLYTVEHRTTIPGQFYGSSELDALQARERLGGLFNDGRSIQVIVNDDNGPSVREAWLIDFDAPWKRDTHFAFTIALVEPDPRRYGPIVTDEDGVPTASSGLYWNLGTAPSGLFLDWGTDGNPGQVAFTNTGRATSSPMLEVGGNGGFAAGFRVTEIETGRELTVTRATSTGDVIRLDSRRGRATLNGGDVTGSMSSRKWFTVPAGATRTYQLTPLGGVTGAPTIKLTAQPANL